MGKAWEDTVTTVAGVSSIAIVGLCLLAGLAGVGGLMLEGGRETARLARVDTLAPHTTRFIDYDACVTCYRFSGDISCVNGCELRTELAELEER